MPLPAHPTTEPLEGEHAPDELLAVRAGRTAAQSVESRQAFEVLVQRYSGRVRSVIERQVRDHHFALDLAQEVWIRAFRALPGFRPATEGGRFRPWLFTIAFNIVRDFHRSRGSDLEGAEAEPLQTAPAAERYNPSGRVEELAAIDEALEGVPEPFGAALHLVDVIGLSYQEAAQSLDCSVGTVKSRVNRGRLTFRDLYLRLSGDRSPSRPIANRDSR